MKSKATSDRYPAQPNLVVFPLGPLVTAIVFDGMNLFKDRPDLALISYWTTALGLIASLIVMIPVWTDWLAVPAHTRAKQIGLLHGAGNVLVVAFLGLSWCFRNDESGHQPTLLALVCSVLAFVLLSLTGWFDSERTERY